MYIVFLCAVFWGCEFLFVILLNLPAYLFHLNSVADLSSIPWQVFTLKLLTYFICCIYKQCSNKSSVHMDKQIFLCYLCIPLSSIAIMLLTYYSGLDFSSSSYMRVLLCMFFAIFQFGNLLIFRIFQKYSEELYTKLENDMIISEQSIQLKYYQKRLSMNEDLKELVHDTTHHYNTLHLLLKNKDYEQAFQLSSELKSKLNTSIITCYTKSNILNAILTEKMELAKEHKIQMNLDIRPDLSMEEIAPTDLVSILANLLDNAIDACKKCEHFRILELTIATKNEDNFYLILLKNRFSKPPKRLHGNFVTSKNGSNLHGTGTKSIRHAVETNHGDIDYSIEDDFFVTTVVLPRNTIPQNT